MLTKSDLSNPNTRLRKYTKPYYCKTKVHANSSYTLCTIGQFWATTVTFFVLTRSICHFQQHIFRIKIFKCLEVHDTGNLFFSPKRSSSLNEVSRKKQIVQEMTYLYVIIVSVSYFPHFRNVDVCFVEKMGQDTKKMLLQKS